ncbi:MAG: DUF4381 domain-containing protein [Rudaea sp.]
MNPAAGPVLRDIHLPPPPSWWPPAPGWWLLAALSVGIAIFIFLYVYKKIRRQRRRRTLMAEFDRTVAAAHGDPPVLAAALSAFLRRLSLTDAPASAALSGNAWLEYLDKRIASDEFSAGVGRALIEAPYRAHTHYDAPALIALVRRTLRQSFECEGAHA